MHVGNYASYLLKVSSQGTTVSSALQTDYHDMSSDVEDGVSRVPIHVETYVIPAHLEAFT